MSRDKPLMLSWQFYDQNVTMIRVNAGRVLHFDFSTEYEEKITEEFLEYLKRVSSDKFLVRLGTSFYFTKYLLNVPTY